MPCKAPKAGLNLKAEVVARFLAFQQEPHMNGFFGYKGIILYLLLQSSLLLPSLALSAVYYLSNSGNDANSGLAPGQS